VKTYAKDEPINIGRFLCDHGAQPRESSGPFIVRDYYNGPLAYQSPLSGRKIDSRSERLKEMREHRVREVDPSEQPFHRREDRRYTAPDHAARRGLKLYKED
jgi:hypothetical protein